MKGKLHLKTRPDGYGYIYGVWVRGDETVRVDIMPPRAHWDGDVMLPDGAPHATDWVVYANGEEIARVKAESLSSLEGALQSLPSPVIAPAANADAPDDKPLTFLRALRAPEFWLSATAAVVAMFGVAWWVVVPLTLAALTASSMPKYIELFPRARDAGAGAERAWWMTVGLSMLNNLAAACGAFLAGLVTRWLWW